MLYIKNTSENKTFYATAQSAGFDISSTEEGLLDPGEYRAFSTGLYIDVGRGQMSPPGYVPELQIRSRSGLAFKNGIAVLAFKNDIAVLNEPGTIDADYPNEIKVILINHGKQPFLVEKGMRIAQGVVALTVRAEGDVDVKDTVRTGGFGSTGSKQ